MPKLCCVFNTPSLYREIIYTRIDKEYDCDWYFEDADSKLVEFNTGKLKCTKRLKTKNLGAFYWVKGTLSLLRRKEYTQYLMMGATRNLSTLAFLLLKKVFYPKKRAYLWTHGFYGKETFVEGVVKRLLLNSADELLIYGDYACNMMLRMGFRKERLHAIHNSLDYDTQLAIRNHITLSDIYKKHFRNDNPVLIFIGRLTKVKKLGMLVNAVAELKAHGENYNLVFVGDGVERENIEMLVREKEVEKQVWFYGGCYDENANAELIYNADLCVAPGNIGLTAIHSLAFGCPALTHGDFSHQMPEFEVIKDEVTGTFFERDNLNSMCAAISKWFGTMSAKRNEVRQACYNVIDTEWNPDYQMHILNQIIRQ